LTFAPFPNFLEILPGVRSKTCCLLMAKPVRRYRTESALPPGGEECLQQRGGFIGANACRDFDAVVDSRMLEDGEARVHRASLGIVGAVNEPRDARLQNRARTHRARLDCHVKSGPQQAMIPNRRSGGAQRNHFRMRRGIAIRDRAVGGARNDAFPEPDNAADRHLPSRSAARASSSAIRTYVSSSFDCIYRALFQSPLIEHQNNMGVLFETHGRRHAISNADKSTVHANK